MAEGARDSSTTAMVGVGTAGIESSPHAIATMTRSMAAKTTMRDTAESNSRRLFRGHRHYNELKDAMVFLVLPD